jgi:hypothetical protein
MGEQEAGGGATGEEGSQAEAIRGHRLKAWPFTPTEKGDDRSGDQVRASSNSSKSEPSCRYRHA